ncbi:hypothetical protein MJO28_005107 [Puccinia striiformis f. sp. tritici]|uniref:Uncharacterized protein n=1 Tax=Puccinia striiformis f. sp. tritici TaxID=168172 RepID=A0ACC0EJ55_9BASI|nr:hypothetical protein MJO28_005107 [Puccinia striiformis f. sp. tritici]
MESREWAKERGYTLAYLTNIFEDIQNQPSRAPDTKFVEGFDKVWRKKTLILKDRAGPSGKQFRYMEKKQLHLFLVIHVTLTSP